MIKNRIIYGSMVLSFASSCGAMQPLSPPQSSSLKSLQPQKLQSNPAAHAVLKSNTVNLSSKTAYFTLPRDGHPARSFNLVDVPTLNNNDLLFSIIRNKETLTKIMGRTVLQAELNTLANVRHRIFDDIKANLDTQYDSYVGKTGNTKKSTLRDHFASIITTTNLSQQALIAKNRGGTPLKTAEETLQFILDNQLPLDSFFAEVISVLYGLNVQVMTPSSSNPAELKEELTQPVFVKAAVDPLFVFHSGVGDSSHFNKLYLMTTSGQPHPGISTSQSNQKVEAAKKNLSQNQAESKKVPEKSKGATSGANTQFTLQQGGQPAVAFNLVNAVRLDNNDLLFSIIRNKETLAKIMGRRVLQAELNTLTNVRGKIFEDIRANLDKEYDTYGGKVGPTKKTKLRDHFASIIANTNTSYQSLIKAKRAGNLLTTAEETLQFIFENQLPLDNFFAEMISLLYGLNVQVMMPSSSNSGELKAALAQPVFVKAAVDPLFVLQSGVGTSTHFDKLYPAIKSGQAPSVSALKSLSMNYDDFISKYTDTLKQQNRLPSTKHIEAISGFLDTSSGKSVEKLFADIDTLKSSKKIVGEQAAALKHYIGEKQLEELEVVPGDLQFTPVRRGQPGFNEMRKGYEWISNQNAVLFKAPANKKRLNTDVKTFKVAYNNIPHSGGGDHITILELTDQDSIDASKELAQQGFKTVVVNFANKDTPGGGYLHGSLAQEEDICRRTNLYPVLAQMQAGGSYPINHDELIITHEIKIFRDNWNTRFSIIKGELPSIGVITMAAYNLNTGMKLNDAQIGGADSAAYKEGMKEKIRAQFRIAAAEGYEAVVAGAFGCGVFAGKDPKKTAAIVSTIYREVLEEPEFAGVFKVIRFAILNPQSDNYLIFKNELIKTNAYKLDNKVK